MTLRARLLLVLVGVLAAGLVVCDLVTFTAVRTYLVDQVGQQVEGLDLRGISNAMLECADADFGAQSCWYPGAFGGGSATILPDGAFAELQVATGRSYEAWLEPSGGTLPPFPAVPNDLLSRTLPYGPVTVTAPGGAAYEAYAEQAPFDVGGEPVALVVALPLAGVVHDMGRLLVIEVLVSAAALVGLGALSWWLVRRELQPLRDMATTAGAIAAGDLSRRVGRADRHTEVGQLGLALNTMLGEIESAFAARAASEEQLRRFLADASHELRTPLTSIRGYAEMFDRGARDRPEDLELVMRRIRSEADRMGVLVEDLLLLSRLGQERPIAWEAVDLAQVVEEAVNAARAAAGRAVTVQAPASAVVPGDSGRLRQVVDNLVRNALAYSPPDTPVDVTVSSPAVGGVIEVAVADRGPGIPPGDRQRIFQPFERLDPSRARATGGLGLGLAIVAAIVRAHGGSVWVEDRPGGGSVFRMQLIAGAAPSVGIGGAPGVAAADRGYDRPQAGPAGAAPHPWRTTMASDGSHGTGDEHLDDLTRAAEREDAFAAHQADRAPTPDEEAAAPGSADPSVSAHEREMSRRGATVEGEGRI